MQFSVFLPSRRAQGFGIQTALLTDRCANRLKAFYLHREIAAENKY